MTAVLAIRHRNHYCVLLHLYVQINFCNIGKVPSEWSSPVLPLPQLVLRTSLKWGRIFENGYVLAKIHPRYNHLFSFSVVFTLALTPPSLLVRMVLPFGYLNAGQGVNAASFATGA